MNSYSTMDDVARLAGVSQSTVSRVLRGSPLVTDDTKKKVLDAVDKLDFRRNVAATKLAGGRSSEIGIIVPDISNPFFATLYLGAESVLAQQGYSIMLGNSVGGKNDSRAYIDRMLENRAAGVIISSIDLDYGYLANILKKLNVVTIPIESGADCVTADEETGTCKAIDYIARDCGHRRIAFWGFEKFFDQIRKRFHGYQAGLLQNGIPYDPDLVFSSGFLQEEIFVKVEENLPRLTAPDGPTAIFAVNDNTAINILLALKQFGIRVPQDISIVGFDNNFNTTLVTPSLTTVSQPVYEMGQTAAHLLLEQIQSEQAIPARTVVLPTELIVRESVRNLKDV